jgi:hypothetical protein
MIKQRTVYEIEYHEVEKLVHEHFGVGHDPKPYNRQAYNFVAAEECGNDCCIEIPSVSADPFDDDDVDYYQEEIDQFLIDGTPGNLPNSIIMGLLCQRGLIPPGNYLVQVCW